VDSQPENTTERLLMSNCGIYIIHTMFFPRGACTPNTNTTITIKQYESPNLITQSTKYIFIDNIYI